jgi:GH24 family phage-related lysozyme (muramidase)
MSNAMQEQSLNAMREQQLMGAERERNALRQLMSDPNFDISAPDAARRLLGVAPTTGAATYQALQAGQRERRQAQTAATEAALKNFDLSRESLRGIATLPEGDRQAAWEAWRARTEATVPGTRGFIPPTYSDAAFAAMVSKADEIAKNLNERPTALQGPGGNPVLIDRRTGTFRMGTEVPGAGVAAPPTAPRAEGPAMTPGQTMAADFLRRREGFRESPYYDVNAYRAGYGSDTATLADGRVVPVRQGMTVSREDAERDLARRIPEFTQRAVAAIGQDRFEALPPNAQAALISIAYNYGTLPGSIRAAARSGDPAALAQAVAGLAGDNQGVNAGRRREEATMIANAAAPNAMAAPGATTNAMLAPPDAMAVNAPQLPTFAPPRTLAEADYQKRMMDMVADLEKKRIEAERRRGEQPSRVEEEGQTAEARERGKLTAEKEREDRQKQEGRQRLESVLRDMNTQYERLNARAGIPSESRSVGANIGAFAASTVPGQAVSRALATPSQTARNQIESLRNELLQAFKAATGMGAKEADSNADVQRLMSAMSDTTMSIESVRGIMQNFSKRYGLGELNFPETAPAQAPAAAPAARPAEGVPGPRRGAAAPTGRPTLEQFLERARPANPNASIEDLTAYYNRTYGDR